MTHYALWCLRFRKPRDSFGGRRRVAAFELLSCAAKFMDIPEAVNLARELAKSNRDDGAAATDFLMNYYEMRDMRNYDPEEFDLEKINSELRPTNQATSSGS